MQIEPLKVDLGPSKSKEPGRRGRVLLLVSSKQSIVVVVTALLDDHDLGVVISPAVVVAMCPSSMKAAIMMAVFRDDNCSILSVRGYGWHRSCDHAQGSQADKKCAHVFLLSGDYPPTRERTGRCEVPFLSSILSTHLFATHKPMSAISGHGLSSPSNLKR